MNPGKRRIGWEITLIVANICVFLVCALFMQIATLTSVAFGFYAVVAMSWSFLPTLMFQFLSPGPLDSGSVGWAVIYGSSLLNAVLIYVIATFLKNRLPANSSN